MENSINTASPSVSSLQAELARHGFARIPGQDMLASLGVEDEEWREFVRSWDDLGPDGYMADGGRYRRRRHAALRCERGRFSRKPHQPHFQSRDYNPLNGDVQRWFDPVHQDVVDNPVMQAVFAFCAAKFDPDAAKSWHVEMHQFRIETREDEAGRPTPEGLHRDGVDWVFVMLADRCNVREGVTRIGTADARPLGEFTLARPGDAVLIEDHRILHGVTEIHPVDPSLPAWRDALVVTFVGEA